MNWLNKTAPGIPRSGFDFSLKICNITGNILHLLKLKTMETSTRKKFNIYTAFSFMTNGIHKQSSQLSYLIDIAKGIIETAQARTDTPYKTIGAPLFFHKLEEDLIKNVLHSEHDSIPEIDEEDLVIEIRKDSREMFVVAPVVFPALFLIIYFFRWKMQNYYTSPLKKKITFVITGDDLIIKFSAKEDDGMYIDFHGDINSEFRLRPNDFLTGNIDDLEGGSRHFDVLRLINMSQRYTADLFDKHPSIFGNRKPVDPFISFGADAECMSFKIENAFRAE